jgi:4-amino-4-deoxy-L-arabinose transferase-like glycosyltransferase
MATKAIDPIDPTRFDRRPGLGRLISKGRPGFSLFKGRGHLRHVASGMFWVGLGLRVVFLTLARTYAFRPSGDYFGFGWETGRIARSIAIGQGFSSPFHRATGPTAWLAPVYPFILGGIFKLFGVYSGLSGWVILTFNSLCCAATCIPIYRIGKEISHERAGRIAGWTWALLPYTIYWPTRLVWETSLTTFLLVLAFMLALHLQRSSSIGLWSGFACVWALLALSNPVTLSFAPFCWGWVYYRQRRRGIGSLLRLGSAALLSLLVITPWLVRNYKAFGQFVFIRSNLGEELRLGNGPGAMGEWMVWLHPTQNARELDKYERMGEVAYLKGREEEAIRFILENPRAFLANTTRRIYWYWGGNARDDSFRETLRQTAFLTFSLLSFTGLGLMVVRRHRARFLFASLLIAFPLVYYATFTLTRYRVPLEPEMLLLVVYLITDFKADRAYRTLV